MLGNSTGRETAICTFAAGEVGTGLVFKMQRQAAGILPLPVLVPNVNRALALTTTRARQAVRGRLARAVAGDERLHDEVPAASRYNPGMKYSLRSLMIAVLVLPPLLAWGWFAMQPRVTWKEALEEVQSLRPHGGGLRAGTTP